MVSGHSSARAAPHESVRSPPLPVELRLPAVVAEFSTRSESESGGGAGCVDEADTGGSPAGKVTGAASASTHAAVHEWSQPDPLHIAARCRLNTPVPPKRAWHGPGTYGFDKVNLAGSGGSLCR